jgi:kynurenine formamidase
MRKAKKNSKKMAPKARKPVSKTAKKSASSNTAKKRTPTSASNPKRKSQAAKTKSRTMNAKPRPMIAIGKEHPSRTAPVARPKAAVRPAVAERPGTGPLIPRYDELPIREGAPTGAAWGVFGDEDEVGTINLQTPERVVAAASSIRTGRIFPLNLPINIPDPPLFTRGAHTHTIKIFPGAEFVLDDYLDNFYPQASSQWDALAHVKHPLHGAYNGIPDHEITGRGGMRLGIDNLARRGIAGRGVLADIASYYDQTGKSIDFSQAESIPLEDLQATLEDQGTTIRPGDVLLIRIGWTRFYLSASDEVKEELARETVVPGIEGTERVARWLWDNNIAAVGSDSPALEALPKAPGNESEFLHFHMLAFFGMPIGEMWFLEDLAEDCASDGRYDFFFTSAPLNIPGGVGSPPNALAIK